MSDGRPTEAFTDADGRRRQPRGGAAATETKKLQKTKFVSSDRSHSDDEFCPKIVEIGAILGYFWPLQSSGLINPPVNKPRPRV